MSFAWPHMLWLSLLAPLALAIQAWRDRRAGPDVEGPRILRGEVLGGRVRLGRIGRRRAWLHAGAVLLVAAALARPQGAPGSAPEAGLPAGPVVIALDLSRSMLAADAAPSRLERARALAQGLEAELADHPVGLLAFAGSTHVLAPPSEDRALMGAFLPALQPWHLVEAGTDFAAMLDGSLAAFGETPRPGRVLVVLSDGEAQPGAWRDRLGALDEAGVAVVAVGLGSPDGAPVVDVDGRPVRDAAGTPVVSRAQPAVLTSLAEATGGRYLEASRLDGPGALAEAVRTIQARAGEAASPVAMGPGAGRREWSALFLAAALIMLAVSLVREHPAEPRPPPRRGGRFAAATICLAALLPLLPPSALSQSRPPDPSEAEPLDRMVALVERLIAKPALDAGDYLAVAEVAIRYGEIHRGHGHALEDGVLRDGLEAVDAGRRLDPRRADWTALEARLRRLRVPPPPVPLDDPGPADPANEPLDGTGELKAPDEAGDAGGQKGTAGETQEPTAGEQGLQSVGGAQRDVFDPAEWRNTALVRPLAVLEALRREDSPADLFRLMQPPVPHGEPLAEQTW